MTTSQRTMAISLIGRPNVGKSSLFNALMRQAKKAITFDTPGVTRDRHYGIATFDDLHDEDMAETILVDTGGFYPQVIDDTNSNVDKFFNIMAEHAKLAIAESDLVLFVVDVREGVLPFDQAIADYLRAQKKNFLLIINKYDSDKQMGSESEFYALGCADENMFKTSAAHRLGMGYLRERIHREAIQFNHTQEKKNAYLHFQKGVKPRENVVAKLAIIGGPNAGKSTLLNQLVGAKRALVSDIPGTTVDPIEGYFDLYFGPDAKQLDDNKSEQVEQEQSYWRSLKIVDTAGIRKQKKIEDFIESQSVFRSLKSITEADIVLCLVDAVKGIGHQDRRIIDIALEKGKSVIMCVNKIDLLKDKLQTERDKKEWLLDLRDTIPWLDYCDLIPISAKFNKHLKALKNSIKKTILVRRKEIPTGELNRFVNQLVEKHSIVLKKSGGARFRVKYSSMVKKSPPTFLLFSNKSLGVPDNYRRYLQKGLREEFGLYNTPVHLIFRSGTDTDKVKAETR
ncbi:MAG: ribosome biogenesis GTPase Der [Bacteriovoracaceae bacterium]|nr:ribosome biogenesis GTPase Der [Bacteriovoracaceae bacterium]